MPANKSYRFFLEKDILLPEGVKWVLMVFAQYTHVKIEFVDEKTADSKSIAYSESADIKLSKDFWRNTSKSDFNTSAFNQDLVLRSGDLLGTAFYFLNCLWERDENRETDHWGRSEFTSSIWKEFAYDRPFCVVNTVFDHLAQKIGVSLPKNDSRLFLSHDIDAVYSAWQEDGKIALKQGKIFTFLKGIVLHFIGRPAWFNFESIANLEKRHRAKSTFFWITSNKKIPGIGKNADYKIDSSRIQKAIEKLRLLGSSHGIHKSIDHTSLKDEVIKMGFEIQSNRYHYLKFAFNNLIDEVNNSGLAMDASLGYAEVHGFRNGYSLPFVPFDLENKASAKFIEVPLVIMDATFSRYHKLSGEEASKIILSFLEENKYNSVVSVLWHNSHFTDLKYQGFPKVYEDILKFTEQNKIKTVSPFELIAEYLN
jgi:hypothetical protein